MMSDSQEKRHRCDWWSDSAACGSAVDYCVEDGTGRFWAGNGEYESRVNWCPYCGARAPVQRDEESEPSHYVEGSNYVQ